MLHIDKPPLISFRIDFKFKSPENITFEKMARVEEILKEKSYDKVPNIQIIEYPVQLKVPIQIGPINFMTQEKDREFQLFANSLIFIYTDYTHWEHIKIDLIEILIKTCNILDIELIEEFRFEYIDHFDFKREEFKPSDFFNLSNNYPASWSIDYRDFHIGIKIISENEDKFIIRLRGLPPTIKENFLFRLESIYIKEDQFNLDKKDILVKNLDLIHDYMRGYFLDIMTDKLKQKLGVREIDRS